MPSHMIIAGHRALIAYEGQTTTCYNCNEQGHHFVECPYRRSSNPSHTSTRAESWVHVATRGTSRQQQEERARVIAHTTDELDMDPYEQGTLPLGANDCQQSQSELTQLSTNEPLTGGIAQKQDEECTTPQNLVDNGWEDNPKDSEGMETEVEVEEMTTDTNQRTDVDPSTPGDCKKRDHNTNVPVVSNFRLMNAPTVTGGDLPLQAPLLSPKRPKKLKTNTDTSTPRDRSRSRHRHKLQQRVTSPTIRYTHLYRLLLPE